MAEIFDEYRLRVYYAITNQQIVLFRTPDYFYESFLFLQMSLLALHILYITIFDYSAYQYPP